MKKILFLFAMSVICMYGFSQKLETYTAINGVTYSIGDTITIGVGSAPDGGFEFIYSGLAKTIFASIAEEQGYDPRLPDYCHGRQVVIKKIRKQGTEVLFNFTTDELGGYVIDIDNAIRNCELAQCLPEGAFLTQEQFEKLILLSQAYLDGNITLEKFNHLRKEITAMSQEGELNTQ